MLMKRPGVIMGVIAVILIIGFLLFMMRPRTTVMRDTHGSDAVVLIASTGASIM